MLHFLKKFDGRKTLNYFQSKIKYTDPAVCFNYS